VLIDAEGRGLVAVTEQDEAYGLDPVTGKVVWKGNVGPEWPASDVGDAGPSDRRGDRPQTRGRA
jgi:hypothetical protein